jgi:23S rRNA (guanosine2251-2'-O)-methyltransferase
VNKQQLNKLTKNQVHQGIAAEILLPTLPNQEELMNYISKLKKIALILILDSIQDPRNLK